MPRYDYTCAGCGATEEADRAISRRHEAPVCARCGGATALCLGAPLVVFRGAGWMSPTTTDKLRSRAAEHAARGHRLPLRARRTR
jgi:putative FmdB family regulatory protein